MPKVLAANPPLKVLVEFVPRTLRKPCKVLVPVVDPCKVEVAVRPMYIVSKAERLVVEAWPLSNERPLTVKELRVPREVRLSRVVIPEMEEEAERRLSNKVSDQYLFVEPWTRASVVVAEKKV
jgi:hypothetical protein